MHPGGDNGDGAKELTWSFSGVCASLFAFFGEFRSFPLSFPSFSFPRIHAHISGDVFVFCMVTSLLILFRLLRRLLFVIAHFCCHGRFVNYRMDEWMRFNSETREQSSNCCEKLRTIMACSDLSTSKSTTHSGGGTEEKAK